jgi:O-antigen/teichoic acid export membrane protein
MMTLDRFLIGALVSVSAVTYYATPYEMVTKLWIFPAALAGVFFPAFSAGFISDRRATSGLFATGVRVVFLAIVPTVLVIVTFAREGLSLWLGDEFAGNSGRVLQILAIGVCVNSLSNIPFALTQGAGRSDLAAKLQLIELPIYVPVVLLAARWFGIEGVAVVWMVRSVLNTAAIFVIAGRLLERPEPPMRAWVLAFVAGLLGIAYSLFPLDLPGKIAFFLIALAAFARVGWANVLTTEERRFLKTYVDGLRARMPYGSLATHSQDAI